MAKIKANKKNIKRAEELMNRLDKLVLLKHNMSIKEAQEILDDFTRVMIFLNESSCYSSPYKPKSLLPRKKGKIEIAFAVAMKFAHDTERKQALYLNYCNLIDVFRSDKEAEKLNNRFLSNCELLSAVKI
ncbi:MAG: hypothetical protein ABID04_01520 [Patescibacteria group bacterium]